MLMERRERSLMGPAEAARRLGVSVKALRVYERHGLARPHRTGRGWRLYGAGDMARLSQALAFRAMGFSLSQIATLLDAGPEEVVFALASQEAQLRSRRQALEEALEAVREAKARYGRPVLCLAA